MGDLLYIRDSITVDDTLAGRLAKPLAAGAKIRLVARSVRHAAGYTLQLPGADLTIVAQEYDGNGGGVSVAGAAGAVGAEGVHGATHGLGRDGGPGGNGGPGGAGAAGGSIRVLCERLVAGRFCADGGVGGAGGAGGDGGAGGAGRPPIPRKTEGTDPGAGGPGGNGGQGGPGGAGGSVQVGCVSIAAMPVSSASGGSGGAGGAAGEGGPDGGFGGYAGGEFAASVRAADPTTRTLTRVEAPTATAGTATAATVPALGGTRWSSPTGEAGRPGAPGTTGAAGRTSTTPLTSTEYWQQVAALLGTDAHAWADARLAAGQYFYRRDNLRAAGPQTNLAVAAGEFDRVLRLRPGDADAARLAGQIAHNQNILGLARNLDVTPNFPAYINAYTAWGTHVFGVFDQGIEMLLSATAMDTVRQLLGQHLDELQGAIVAAGADRAAAVAGQKAADQTVKITTDKVQQLTRQIEAARKEMEDSSISIGGIISTVAEVAGAVVAVIAAIPTAGASLVALVPACITLAKTVFDDGPALVSSLFGDGSVPKEVKEAYDKAGQDVSKLVAAGKAVVNLVDVIEKLDQAKTAANAKYTDLVKQGVEAAHALTLAQLSAAQADLQVAAADVKLEQAKALKSTAEDLMTAQHADTATILAAGQTLIDAAALRRDDLLTDAFLAQRAVEIYTDAEESATVRMDAGYLHPDVLADYAEGYRGLPALVGDYTASWTSFLAPMDLQRTYLGYFDGTSGQLDIGWHRITIRDKRQLADFKRTHSFVFEVRLGDLPAHHYEAKVQSVAVSFVHATSPSGVTSCDVGHGARYEEKGVTGTRRVQLLQPHTDTVLAPHTRLSAAGVTATSGDPLQTPLTSPIWGRGVAGQWSLTIPRSEIARRRTDLRKLTEIDIWIAYQFRTT